MFPDSVYVEDTYGKVAGFSLYALVTAKADECNQLYYGGGSLRSGENSRQRLGQ